MGDLSQHFDSSEFVCHHCGQLGPFGIDPELVRRLELVRARIGKPLPIVSAYRCPEHNRRIGGAKNSQHIWGRAADLPRGLVPMVTARAAGFSGIGNRRGAAVHVDVRWQWHVTEWDY